jgi:hypothetical protein
MFIFISLFLEIHIIFCSTGAWSQSLYLEPLHISFCDRYFWDRVSQTICLGWLWTSILLISASCVTRITGWATTAWPFLEILFVLKSTSFYINMATVIIFHKCYHKILFFISLLLTYLCTYVLFYKKSIFGPCFFLKSDNFLLSFGVFRPFVFNLDSIMKPTKCCLKKG